jgi:hypothetical protein
MRSTLTCVAVLILAGGAVFFWQRSQIVHLRAQVARQGDALEGIAYRLDASIPHAGGASALSHATRAQTRRDVDDAGALARADERRVILDEYRDVLARMNLPPETASRLQDLLTDRIETVLDAQDAAVREGFAEGSAEMARAVGVAITQVDRDILGLVGQDGIRRIDGLPAAQPPEAPVAPQAPASVVVNVVVQAPAPQALYAEAPAQAESSDVAAQYASYPYPYFPVYPIAVLNEPRGRRGINGPRNFGDRTFRNPAIFAR